MQQGETTKGPSIATRIVEQQREAARDVNVADVRIGLGYTAVMLADGRAGVAYTFREEAQGGCTVFRGRRPLAGRPAADLLALLPSTDRIEAAVGLACANALGNTGDVPAEQGDVARHLDLRADDDVAMVGRFGPLIDEIRSRARSLTILERAERAQPGVRPAEEAGEVLPQCAVALITATSIINHTIEPLLQAAAGARVLAVLGASTPMAREVFTGTSVSLLSGVVVEQPGPVLQTVSEGGGMRQFKPFVRKVCVRVDEPPN